MPPESPCHRLVIAPGDLYHHVVVRLVCEASDHVHRCLHPLISLLIILKDHVGGLSPLHLQYVPDLLNWVELAALRRQELLLEGVVEHVLDDLGLVHAEVVYDDYASAVAALLLELGDERVEGVSVVAAGESNV